MNMNKRLDIGNPLDPNSESNNKDLQLAVLTRFIPLHNFKLPPFETISWDP